MNLKEIATVSGKGGLFRVVKPTRTGVILESMDERKNRLVVGANQRVSVLQEISMYTTGEEQSVGLENVLRTVYDKYGQALPVDAKSSPDELVKFMQDVLPDYDAERVYASDIKKLVVWYLIIQQYVPEFFTEPADADAPTDAPEEIVEKTPPDDAAVKSKKPSK